MHVEVTTRNISACSPSDSMLAWGSFRAALDTQDSSGSALLLPSGSFCKEPTKHNPIISSSSRFCTDLL